MLSSLSMKGSRAAVPQETLLSRIRSPGVGWARAGGTEEVPVDYSSKVGPSSAPAAPAGEYRQGMDDEQTLPWDGNCPSGNG